MNTGARPDLLERGSKMTIAVQTTALVLAAGGERVVPWEIGVMAGLADAGADPRRAGLIVGTSAGALTAAQVALGADPRELARAITRDGVPGTRREVLDRAATALPRLLDIEARTGHLDSDERCRRVGSFALSADAIPEAAHVAAATARLPSGRWPDRLRLLAVDAQSGRRVRLDAACGAAVGRGVAAARAVPGVLAPVRIGDRPLIDAAVRSGTNADAAASPAIDRVLAITAAAPDPRPGTIDAVLESSLAGECAALAARGISVDVLRAGAAAREAMGDQLYDVADAAAAAASGRESGQRFAANRTALAARSQNPVRSTSVR